MKTSLEKTSGLGRKINFEIPAEKVTTAFDRVYKGLQRNATIKGFRKGKAPLDIIRKTYSDRVHQDVLEDLVSEAYSAALREHTLRPITEPQVRFDNIAENSPFLFSAEFEIRPEVPLKKTTKLKVEKEKLEIEPKQVDEILQQIRESRATTAPVFDVRSARDGDIVDISFRGLVNGAPLEGGASDSHKLALGSNSFIPGFESGLIGMNVGETRVLNLQFPADYGHKEIAGQPVEFTVVLKSILKKDLPALDDEFAKQLGGYNSIEELRKVIMQDLEDQESKRIHDDTKTRVLKELVRENPVEVPATLLNKQRELLLADVEARFKKQGLGEREVREYAEKWQKDIDETAAFMIQSSFLIETLAEEQGLQSTAEEFETRLEQYAAQSRVELPKVKEYYKNNPDRKNQVHYQITEEKVVDYLLKNADLKEVPKEKLAKE